MIHEEVELTADKQGVITVMSLLNLLKKHQQDMDHHDVEENAVCVYAKPSDRETGGYDGVGPVRIVLSPSMDEEGKVISIGLDIYLPDDVTIHIEKPPFDNDSEEPRQ